MRLELIPELDAPQVCPLGLLTLLEVPQLVHCDVDVAGQLAAVVFALHGLAPILEVLVAAQTDACAVGQWVVSQLVHCEPITAGQLAPPAAHALV